MQADVTYEMPIIWVGLTYEMPIVRVEAYNDGQRIIYCGHSYVQDCSYKYQNVRLKTISFPVQLLFAPITVWFEYS